jgi:type I restriction enzyme, S subunit
MSSAQVPEGYKQTEVGVIPKDWKLKTIGDLGSVSSGGTPSRANPLYWGGDIPWITTTQIDFNFITDAEQFITQDGLNNSAAKLFNAGTLLMAMYGQGKTRGKVAILGIKASINQACAAISLNENIEHGYIFIYLVNQYEIIRTLSNIGNQENLSGQIIKSIKIALPSRSEQKTIAQALSDVDALIASLDKLIAKQRQLKTAAMQQLLTGKMRSFGFGEGKGYKQTDIGLIPDDWNVQALAEICIKIQDGTHFSPSLGGDDYFYITSKNIGRGVLYLSDVERIDSFQHKVIYSRCDVKKGDLLLTKDGVNTGNAALNHLDEEFSLLSSVAFLRFDAKNNNPNYFLQQILSPDGQNRIKELMSGNAITRLTLEKIRRIKFLVPSLNEQCAIATVLSDMDGAIAALEKRRAKTQAIKQGMMQELLTGRTRLI